MSNDNSAQESLEDLTANTISVAEASKISKLTPSWIRRLLIRGDIKGIKIGRDWRMTREALQAYLEKERRPGPKTK